MTIRACFNKCVLPLDGHAGFERPDVGAGQVAEAIGELVGAAGERREGAEVQRNDVLRIEHAAGQRRFERAHRVKIADGQKRKLGMVEAFDELHVGEDVGVAGAIGGALIGEADDVARGLAAVDDFAVVGDAQL